MSGAVRAVGELRPIYVGIGSNVEREQRVRQAVAALRERFGGVVVSGVYESDAVGFDGPAFFNLVAGFRTDLDPPTLLAELKRIESRCGRRAGSPRFGSRTMDIDLLLYGEEVIDGGELKLPRPEIIEHAFVLGPLAEIAGELRDPHSGETFARLWEAFPREDGTLRRVEMDLGQ